MNYKKTFLLVAFLSLLVTATYAQTPDASCIGCTQAISKLETTWNRFMADPQLQYALAGICVLDAQSGKLLFEKNSNTGMAPASTQKILTSIAAFETLGPAFTYKTRIGYSGKIENRRLKGDLVIEGSGDPSFGSSRYTATNRDSVLLAVFRAVRAAGIDAIDGNIITTNKGFDLNPTPPGWIWGDIGNYYGAGTLGLNWNENQYQLFIKTGSATGASTNIVSSDPPGYSDLVANNVSTGKPGTGDGSVIYADPFSSSALIQGKLEPNKTSMMVSGAMPNADEAALNAIREYLVKNGIAVKGTCITPLIAFADGMSLPSSVITVDSIVSPTLDSLNYWFLHKSINLYGEAFLRTIGLLKTGRGTNDDGIDAVQQYYTANGFDAESMHLYDGCGLSPANRVTPQTLTRAMYLAKSKSWFPDFYDGLPLYNDMKLKSGTINRVKCFTGYSKSKAGADYVVTIMVNNYNGSSSSLVSKMYSVLDCLK